MNDTILGFEVARDTDEHYPRFVEVFREVWQRIDGATQNTIRGWLRGIEFSKDGLDPQGTKVWGVCNTETQHILFYCETFNRSLEFAQHIVAHELAHAKQAAGGLDADNITAEELARLKLLWLTRKLEVDADNFAAELGFPRTHGLTLELQGLPVDPSFSGLCKNWKHLDETQRLAFARRAADIRYRAQFSED